tara:strand:- start:228 stop:464 length:237 start_codon:yes stop_codon:yes gene_type:complete
MAGAYKISRDGQQKKPRGNMKHYPLLTLHEVAEALNVAPRTIYAWGKQGKIPAFKLGTKWMFDLKEIDAWVERQRLND